MMTDVMDAVINALTAAGLSAGSAWPKTAIESDTGFLCVGVAHAEICAGGFARYFGIRSDTQSGEHEVYGMRCALELRLDIYAPYSEDNAAQACLDLFDEAAAVISAMPGLQVKALQCDAPAPDPESRLFHLRGSVHCTAALLATDTGENGTFTDFVLRGELQQ